jgi:hypothetical protein
LKPVEVIWEDSQSSDGGWLLKGEEFDEWAASGPLLIRTVGLLERKTKHTLIVVQNDSEGQVCHGIKIPRRCVRSLRKLK